MKMNKHSSVENLILLIVFAIVALVVISCASQGLAATTNEYNQGYNTGINDWNEFNTDTSHHFECPLSHTAPHSDFCKGYDAALMFETSDQ